MFDKPWFTRKQLNIIILVTTLVIALLSMTGPDHVLPRFSQQTIAGKDLILADNTDGLQHLRFTFALTPNEQSSALQPQLLFQLLSQRLSQLPITPQDGWPPIALRLQFDRLQLDLAAESTPSTEQLSRLAQWLTAPYSDQQWLSAMARLKAERYLNQQTGKSPYQQLLPLLGYFTNNEQKNPTAWHDYQQQLFSQAQLSISFLGNDLEDWQPAIERFIKQLPTASPWPEQPSPWSSPQQLSDKPRGYQAILAKRTRGKADPDFAVDFISLRLLSQLANTDTDWKPQARDGLWLLLSSHMSAPQLLEQLRKNVRQLSDKMIEDSLASATKQLQSLKDDPKKLLDQMESIHFYQLPIDYLERLQKQFANLPVASIKGRMIELLEPQQFYWLSAPQP